MRNEVFHKVCFQIAGIPAIQRALDAYNRIGVVRNVVVVGELAGQNVDQPDLDGALRARGCDAEQQRDGAAKSHA